MGPENYEKRLFIYPLTIEREENSWAFNMKVLLIGAAIAALVLVNTHAHDIADAAQFKPVIRTPRIIVRPPNLTPQTKRLLKKNAPSELTKPAATQGGSAAEVDSPSRGISDSNTADEQLRNRSRAATPIPRPRPQFEYASKADELIKNGSAVEEVPKPQPRGSYAPDDEKNEEADILAMIMEAKNRQIEAVLRMMQQSSPAKLMLQAATAARGGGSAAGAGGVADQDEDDSDSARTAHKLVCIGFFLLRGGFGDFC